MGSLGYYNNSFFNSIYSNALVSKITYTFYLGVFIKNVGIKKFILASIVVFGVIGVNSLVYISLVGLKGFYREVFK